ncbi:MAG: hypothetical protein ACK5QH_10240, partial [Rubrivivax sp.]
WSAGQPLWGRQGQPKAVPLRLAPKPVAAAAAASPAPAPAPRARAAAPASAAAAPQDNAGLVQRLEQASTDGSPFVDLQATAAPSTKAQRRANRKSQIAAAQDKLATMSPGQARDDLGRATTRFAENINSVEKAQLAANVYTPEAGPPEGWKNISKDADALRKYGLEPSDLEVPDSQFRAQMYEPIDSVFGGDLKPVVSFKGTTPTSGQDWVNNLRQGLNMHSPYYEKAVAIGSKLDLQGASVEITGHSLGGGMASAASRASGLSATTFNSAGLHPSTVAKYGGVLQDSQIMAYQVDGEVLTGIQEQGIKGTLAAAGAGFLAGGPVGALVGGLAKVGLSAGMHDAVGDRRPLPSSGGNPVARHGMDQVIAGIESQKTEDQATLAAATGIPSLLR